MLSIPDVFLVRLKVSLVDERGCPPPVLRIRLETTKEPLRTATDVGRSGRHRKREQEPAEGANAVLHGAPTGRCGSGARCTLFY